MKSTIIWVESVVQLDYTITTNFFTKNVDPRQEVFKDRKPRSEEERAQMMVDCIPSESLEEIKRRVGERDPKAMLMYADCLLFGLKRLDIDQLNAAKFYSEAIAMNEPEAMAFDAYMIFDDIANHLNKHNDDKRYWKIPHNCIQLSQGKNLMRMWELLDKSAKLGWESYALMNCASDAEQNGSWTLSEHVKAILARIRNEKYVISLT
jgi:hypothetical protein